MAVICPKNAIMPLKQSPQVPRVGTLSRKDFLNQRRRIQSFIGLWMILSTLLSYSQGVVSVQLKAIPLRLVPPPTLQAWMKESKVPRLGIGYIQNDTVTNMQVYTTYPSNPLGPDSILFNVASLTKPVIALLTLTLVSQGQWSLDASLAAYWVDPDLKADPRHTQLTTRHVLAQRTGFVNWRWLHPTKRLTFDSAPGSTYGYSGEGFEYLKRALEEKFNKPLEQLADSILFKPLGMLNTRFYWDSTLNESRFAGEYDRQGQPYPAWKRTDASAADDLLTTVADYSRFCLAVLRGTGLSKPIFEAMNSPQTTVNPTNSVYWGLGWELITSLGQNEYALYHGGSDRGVRAVVVLLPRSKRGLLILTNADGGQDVIRHLVRAVLPEGQELIDRLK